MNDEHLLIETRGGVRTITLNRPRARNALLLEMRRKLQDIFAEAASDDAVSVLVLTGTDPAFCAGIDIKEPLPPGGQVTDPAASLRAVAKPVIGAINGVCVTGGLELALACDILVASEQARFADTHVSLGLVPAWGMTAMLAQCLGTRRAVEMSLGGAFIDASTARSWGLVNHVVPHDELMERVSDIARSLSEADRLAARAVLGVYRRAAGLPFEQALALEHDAWREWRAMLPEELSI